MFIILANRRNCHPWEWLQNSSPRKGLADEGGCFSPDSKLGSREKASFDSSFGRGEGNLVIL